MLRRYAPVLGASIGDPAPWQIDYLENPEGFYGLLDHPEDCALSPVRVTIDRIEL
jgi:hypothetical protein